MFTNAIFWSKSRKPVLNIPATLKFSCLGKLPRGVITKADDIKFKVSPFFKPKSKASSEPI